jgi:hypothetical protein
MTIENSNSEKRESLGFAEAVAEYIAPMLAAQGFACTETTSYVVRFESAQVVLVVSHDRLSYEIQVTFARKADMAGRYVLGQMRNLTIEPDRCEQVFFQASERSRVFDCVRSIANILREYGEAALTGEPAVYERMGEAARLRNAAYTNRILQEPIRKAAEKAWQEHDYVKVRDLYDPIEADLTPTERKRLEYAKSHSCT